MFLLLVTVALLASANGISASPVTRDRPIFPNGRIVGGENAVIETYPYQISVEESGSHNCGGSIISKNYVITAAHCVGAAPEYLTIRSGTSQRSEGGSVHKVTETIVHENYHHNSFGIVVNDIAIVKVKEPFHFDDTHQPIDLYEHNEEAAPGARSVITGWGNTGAGAASQLQTVSVPIITKTLCSDAYREYGGLPAGQICAAYFGVGGKDACNGDSGGPLTIDGRLAGIVSWGHGCAKAYYPGVYTEVAHYRHWINKHVEF